MTDILQPVLSTLLVLGLLAGSLYWLRQRGMAKFHGLGAGLGSRAGALTQLKVTERISLSPQHALHLVTVGDRVLLLATSPGSVAVIDVDATGERLAGRTGR